MSEIFPEAMLGSDSGLDVAGDVAPPGPAVVLGVEASVSVDASAVPLPRSIWVFDHSEICGSRMRVEYRDLASFIKRNRNECPTCWAPLGDPRPAGPEDW
ncbi:hypothetical protein [Nonomuraea sp. NPDC050786]|uniref:hypothetical protein n=1 Tax=Nonomuraea sp. NPDC050786 TaxID=3154840 RepID=UPI003400B5C0